ncbi:sensor histidine kinase [Helicobacter valdiviensis]|nr:HAMP domain-containing sensor histidine kinase [Helicobacter valdiviensis]
MRNSFYADIKNNIYDNIHTILQSSISYKVGQIFYIQKPDILKDEKLKIEIISTQNKITNSEKTYKKDKRVFYEIIYFYKNNQALKITQDITQINAFLDKILHSIIIVGFFGLILIKLFALAFSNILYKPISKLSKSLSTLKESNLENIKEDNLPLEFQPLIASINELLNKIKNHLSYQKQLFIGIAHELKTPLAVMKTKSEVTLLKERDKEKYIESLKTNIKSIDEMNAIIKTILELGRQESAQFEKTSDVDIMKILRELAENFKILAQKENKIFNILLEPQELFANIKPTLLTQIVQNFLQNAFKFTPQNKHIELKSQLTTNGFLQIIVLDEGCGLDCELDNIYAPFRRSGNKSGAGLGLFLAKNAANALGGNISLQNRKDTQGTVATFMLKIT